MIYLLFRIGTLASLKSNEKDKKKRSLQGRKKEKKERKGGERGSRVACPFLFMREREDQPDLAESHESTWDSGPSESDPESEF